MNKKIIVILTLIFVLSSINFVSAEEDDINVENNTENEIEPVSNEIEENTMTNAIWVRGADMNNVNFKTLKDSNIDTVLLNFAAINKYGKSSVEKWVESANANGLNVHIWMQVCYHGGFQNPLKNGELNTGLLTQDINDAREFASISGIKGINLDYIRYPGTASKNPGGVDAITFFVTRITETIKSVNSSLIVSGSLMPERSSLISAYGQNLSALSSVLDYIIPMIYKGNYKQDSSWIKSTTEFFTERSQGAKVISGLQSYKSDSNTAKLSSSELKRDVDAAYEGGASGICIFRYGLTNFIDFKRVTIIDNTVHISTVLYADDYNHVFGEGYDFNGTLKDSEGNNIIGHHVILNLTRLSSGASKLYDVVSDYNGEFRLPINLSPGKYSVSLSYDKLSFNNITYDRANTIFRSLNVDYTNLTSVNLSANLFNESFNSGSNFTGYLLDNESNPITGHTVLVTLKRASNNQSKSYYVISDYTGMYSLGINLSPGEYLAYCSYDGTSEYQSASINSTIIVRPEDI